MPKYVISGGPCSGKTSLINEFSRKGYYVTMEVGRLIIQDEIARGGSLLPWIDRCNFERKVLEIQMSVESKIPPAAAITFLDRGIPDGIAFLKFHGLIPFRELLEASKKCRYDGIFVLDQLEHYFMDSERKESIEEARILGKMFFDIYEAEGYKPIRVPALAIFERVRFIERIIGLV